jgi:hypothetical protein
VSIGSTNYPQPVYVNGFICRNCTDVDNAKKHIDPAHPKSGPYGIDAATDPTNPKSFVQSGSNLAGIPTTATKTGIQSSGQLVDIQV